MKVSRPPGIQSLLAVRFRARQPGQPWQPKRLLVKRRRATVLFQDPGPGIHLAGTSIRVRKKNVQGNVDPYA